MYNHLYTNVRLCPRAVNNSVDLTDEVKAYVMANRVWRDELAGDAHVPTCAVASAETSTAMDASGSSTSSVTTTTTNSHNNNTNSNNTMNQTINVYNQITNIINNMDPIERVSAYVNHTNAQLISLDDKIESMYGDKGNLLDLGDMQDPEYVKDLSLKRDDLLDVIDAISTIKDLEACSDIGLVYDEKLRKIHIREGSSWQSSRFDRGVKTIIGWLQSTYLDSYERYLVRRILTHANARKRAQSEESLRLYFGFIESFDLEPFVVSSDTADEDELFSDENTRERFIDMFQRERAELKKMTRDRYIRDVKEILARNSQKNKMEISRRLLDLVKADEEFKQLMLQRIMA